MIQWLIYADNNDVDGIDFYTFDGPKKEVKKRVNQLVKEYKNEFEDEYNYTTDDVDNRNSYIQTVQCDNFHIEIGAKRISSMWKIA